MKARFYTVVTPSIFGNDKKEEYIDLHLTKSEYLSIITQLCGLDRSEKSNAIGQMLIDKSVEEE